MTRKAQTAGEMKASKNQSRRKSTSQASPTLNESADAVLTRRQAAQLTHQTRSKNKTNKIEKKGELNRKNRDRKIQERKKKRALLSFKKDRSKSSSLNNEISQRNKSNEIGMSSSKNQSASPRKVEQESGQSSSLPEKVTSVRQSDSGSDNFTLTPSKSMSMLDRSKIMLEKELKALRKQIRKPILVLDGPEECYRKGLNGSKDTNEESEPKGLTENEGRCPGFDKFGRPMTDIPDVVIFKEELEDIDEDDIMDIVLCPSPVWWEEPVDEELKTMYKEEGGPQQNTETTAPEVQNQSRTSSEAENNKKKSFTLEKILENIRLKNTNSEKKNDISDQNNTVIQKPASESVIIQKSASENRDFENKIGNISEDTSVSDTNLNVSENIHSVNVIAMEVETQKIASNFKTTTVNYSSEVHEHRKKLLKDATDKEVTLITQVSSPTSDEKSTNNSEEDAITYIVDLTLDDDEDDTEITSFDPDAADDENENLDLKLLKSTSEMDCHIFDNNLEQNVNNSVLNAGTSTENNSKTKSHIQTDDIAKCAVNYDNNDVPTENLKYYANDKQIPNTLIVVEVGENTSVGEANEELTLKVEELNRQEDVECISEENESEQQKSPNLIYKSSVANKGNNRQDLSTNDITRSNAERTESTPKISSVGGCDDIETESVSKVPVFKTETIITVPTIEIDIGNVISEKDLNVEEKSLKKEGNEEDIFIDKMAAVMDEEININIVAANIKQENSRAGCSTEVPKNIDEIESVNLVEIPIKNEHVPEKTDDTNLFQKNLEKNNFEALNENSTSDTATIIALSDLDLDDMIMSKTVNSGSKSTQKTAVTEMQAKTCDKELRETDEDSENPETSINVPNLLYTSTENKEPNVSMETEICTENEASVSSETNVEKPEDKTKRIREEMKVIEEGLRMAQQIQKLSESHIDFSKRNKLLELSSQLLETLKSSMHELKDADDVSVIPSVSENKTSDEIENNNQKETIVRTSSEESTEKDVSVNVELENLRNQNVRKQNTEDIAVCTIVSDNLKKQVKERDFVARNQKIRSTYLGIVDYESNYKNEKITPNQKSDILSNSEKEGWKQSISVSTSKSYNLASELPINESSNSETQVIAPSSRNIILKDYESNYKNDKITSNQKSDILSNSEKEGWKQSTSNSYILASELSTNESSNSETQVIAPSSRNIILKDYESNYKNDKITPNQKSDILSNSEKEGWKQSILVSTSKSYILASELSTNESSNFETQVIAPSSRNIILKDYESNYKTDKISPNQKSDILSNSEKEGWKQSISVSTSKSYILASELSTNESSNSETQVIAPSSRNIILKDIPFSADEVQKLPLNCESLDTSSKISTNDPICGATPVSTSPGADLLANYLPSDANKIWDADNSSNFSCSLSIAEIPQESAKRLPSNSEINITEIMNPDERVSLNSKGMKLGQSLKVIGKLKNCSKGFKRKNTFVQKHLNYKNTEITTICKSNVGKFRNRQISKKRNVKMKSAHPSHDNDISTTFQENIDEYEKKIIANSSRNVVSVNIEDKSSETNKLEGNTSHNLEPKTEIENSENDGSYDNILKSLQSLIDENNGPAIVEDSENQTSRETVSRLDKEVFKPNDSESTLNLNGSEIALADLKTIGNGQNRHIRKLSPQKYVEMNKLVILETAFKSTSIPNISKGSEIEKNQRQNYVEMNSLFIMDSQKDTLMPKLEELVPSNENPLKISNESLKKIREILGIPEFDRSVINLHSLEDITSEKSYTESIDGSLNDEHEYKKIVKCDTKISLECAETFDPKMDLCNTLGIPYVEYSKGDQNDAKHKSLDLKDEGMMKSSPPLEAVVNNIGKENLDNATKIRDVRTKRKRIDYKQLAKGIRNDSSEIKRIKTAKQVKSETDGDTKSLTQDMIANIIGVNATASNDKLENIYLNIDPNLYKNSCKHQKKESETQCQKCTLHFTYKSCIKLLTNSQSDSDSKFAEDASKSVTCNKLYKCGQCDYICARRDNLRTHFRKHTDERPYDCSFCDHRARTKDHLTRHQRTHGNLPKDDWRKSHREAQKMICESAVKTVPEEVFLDHSYARH